MLNEQGLEEYEGLEYGPHRIFTPVEHEREEVARDLAEFLEENLEENMTFAELLQAYKEYRGETT